MPSDHRVVQAVQAVAGQADAFRSALATTLEQVRNLLLTQRGSTNGHVERFQAELGPFAAGRIDAERFANLFGRLDQTSVQAPERIERAFETLSALIAEKEDLFRVDVPTTTSLRDAVAGALDHLGRAFGAARVVALTRADRYRESDHASLFLGFPFERWNGAERVIAPPLVVQVHGDDLRPGGLSEFLDGAQRIVLIVTGECPPAALVRLISPGVFVLQTGDGTGLDRLAGWDGPGVAALVPESAARFIHDPAAGRILADRLRVDYLPESKPQRPLAGFSAAQQAEELAQLQALQTEAVAGAVGAATTPTGEVGAVPPPPMDPADKLAAWLLSQADLTDSS